VTHKTACICRPFFHSSNNPKHGARHDQHIPFLHTVHLARFSAAFNVIDADAVAAGTLFKIRDVFFQLSIQLLQSEVVRG